MPIIKHNENKINKFLIIDNKIFIDDKRIKKGDILHYRCDFCGHSESVQIRSHEDFINNKLYDNKVMCSICLRKKTNLKKYGVENLSQSKEIQDKIKENSMIKYGTKHFLSSPEIRNKIDTTNEERYGTKNIFQSEEIKTKIKNTMMKNHGVEYSLQSDEIKNKFKQSMINKYGTQYAMHSFQIKEKRRTSMQSNIDSKIFNFVHITPVFTKEEYFGINKFYKWKCRECNTIFEDHLNYGHIPQCPHCNPKMIKANRKKHEIVKWLQTVLNINNIILDDDEIIKPYTISIYLKDYHLALEILSLYWDSENQGKDSDYQINKTALCASKGIDILSIFEDEWTLKQKIIKNIIKHKLGLFGNTIQASNCVIKDISNKDARLFYEKNHIQGHVNCQINYGLFHEVEGIVSCFSASTPRFNHKYNWEIIRFANRMGVNVMSSFEEFMKYFTQQKSGSIITYADCRYSDNYIYEKSGMEHTGSSEPNYFYTNYIERRNRLQFQKSKLKNKLKYFDEELTEWQNMQMNGWDRIWDCGSNVFIFKN